MLESVLADVLTRVLGQYLEGIDRDSVRFGAWSGLIELRGVALRPEALAVLFETLGMDLPVTVEAGFIGLLRLHVPWNAIGSTPVQIHMSDITIMARPVRGDGSDDSELQTRERRIKRAKLATDDAVREASWDVSNDKGGAKGWGTWLVSQDLRAKIIDNIQIHLSDILLRFEDPFSDPRRPYIVSIACESLKAVSANAQWMEAYVERNADAPYNTARKLLEVKGFHIDWAPITPRDAPGLSRGTKDPGDDRKRFETAEMLKEFMAEDSRTHHSDLDAASGVQSLLRPVDGAVRLRLSTGASSAATSMDGSADEPSIDLDIRFPNISVELDDVQYASLLQTSVYFARLSTRGFRPKAPAERWMWAIDQMLPGFSTRRQQALQFTEEGILKARDRRLLYTAHRKAILKSRRMGVEEPKDISANLEELEDSLSFEEVMALRDFVDRQIEVEGEDWQSVISKEDGQKETQKGTTMSSFWQMLGYAEENTTTTTTLIDGESREPEFEAKPEGRVASGVPLEPNTTRMGGVLLRVSFLLRGVSVRLSQKGFPSPSVPRVSLNLHDLRAGLLYDVMGNLTVEAVLGSIDAWDMVNGKRMVYSKLLAMSDMEYDAVLGEFESSYPHDVSEAIEAIRSGSNPAKDLIEDEESASDEEAVHLPGDQYFGTFEDISISQELNMLDGERKSNKERLRGASRDREATPTTFRVTASEFLGTAKQSATVQKYVAAFRYTHAVGDGGGGGDVKSSGSKLDVSVATLEAIVDGPKGSFLWGLKFWQPKGMAQDPIMAFLGAAAGARIAELRMELEEALLANKVPMEINAVILAPRFILASTSERSPAVVVNMGILGVCTSDNAPEHQSSPQKKRSRLRYSNYVLTLDDLGVYFAPDLLTAVSQELRKGTDHPWKAQTGIDFREARHIDTTDVERIIRPFSLRFLLQTLRDANVVQVAHAPSGSFDIDGSNIAKVRVRGNIPGLYLIVTQKSVQHFIVEGNRWALQMKSAPASSAAASRHPSGEVGWQPLGDDEQCGDAESQATAFVLQRRDGRNDEQHSQEQVPGVIASYDIKVVIQKVSVEVRDSMEVRLVTAVASSMRTSVVKTGKTKLEADFSLRSWAVTDGSRGSTAAFRRLVYAGVFAGSEGVSPPRMSKSGDAQEHVSDHKNFVNIRYTVDLAANHHSIHFRFLSLNMVCVRETYIKLASFLYKAHKKAKEKVRAIKSTLSLSNLGSSDLLELTAGQSPAHYSGESLPNVSAPLKSRISVVSEFDGFSFQLVASGGAIALVEMKDSRIEFARSENGHLKAWGDFRFFAIRDWTAPTSEHAAVVTYEKPTNVYPDVNHPSSSDTTGYSGEGDEWILVIPQSPKERYKLQARFNGIRVCFLYRFSVVLQQYFAVLQRGVQPIVDVVRAEVGGVAAAENGKASQSASSWKSAILVDFQLKNFTVRVPRHSDCPSEAVTTNFAMTHITNSGNELVEGEWRTHFDGVNFAVDYVLSESGTSSQRSFVSSPFLRDFSALMKFRRGTNPEMVLRGQAASSALFVDLRVLQDMRITLCEAQYTVLYFVLTENFSETINGAELSADIEAADTEIPSVPHSTAINQSQRSEVSDGGTATTLDGLPEPSALGQEGRMIVLDLDIALPALSIQMSRGWDVRNDACKIARLHLGNVHIDFTYRTPSHILLEFAGELFSAADLRQEEGNDGFPFVVPLASSAVNALTKLPQRENLTVTYERESGRRPSILVFLTSFQVQILPELLRDLTFLAIPGWPYLRSSAFAPDIVYLGRILTVVLANSQVVLFCDEYEGDRRALVLTGDFQLKMEWMRGTGAKRVSLQSTQLEMSTVSEFPELEPDSECEDTYTYRAFPFDRTQSPLLYPTDSFIEYVGPGVDDSGCRVDISTDSILCLISATEISLLTAILSRPKRMKSSYLVRRQWKQPSVISSDTSSSPTEQTSKHERTRKALENLGLSVRIPAIRYLITDEGNGRFVPILETRLKSLLVNAHVGNMFQLEGEVAVDLFNTKKGWWEPALESWELEASMSQGTSGARAIVIKSDQRMNVNISPTTVTAVVTVAHALKNVTKVSRTQSSVSKRTEDSNDRARAGGWRDVESSNRPSVAAFLVRNQLGFPIAMSLTGTSRRTTIAHNSDLEVGVQTEDLVSPAEGGTNRTRADALKCYISIPRFASQELSASEVGKHRVTFLPDVHRSPSQDELLNLEKEDVDHIHTLWEVEMVSGVPVCTIRSLFRLINDTDSILEVKISEEHGKSVHDSPCHSVILDPTEHYALPVFDAEKNVQLRPIAVNVADDIPILKSKMASLPKPFEWSSSFPKITRLRESAKELQRELETRRRGGTTNSRVRSAKEPIIRCRNARKGLADFHLALSTSVSSTSQNGWNVLPWVDISLRAPTVLENKLAGRLSYRVTQRNASSSGKSTTPPGGEGAVLAAGVIPPLKNAHLHFDSENLRSTFLSLAYENSIDAREFTATSGTNRSLTSSFPSRFGPETSFQDLQMKKTSIVLPSAERTTDSKGQPRRDLRATVQPEKSKGLRLEVSAGFWIRNRSDTGVQVCSRGSYYGSGSQHFDLPARPPFEEPDSFVCLEGPYLSVRLLPQSSINLVPDLVDHSDWWTSPSMLEDITKSVSMNIEGRALELEVRPALGLEKSTFVITIRNSSWIHNSTTSVLQWCQASAVDSHGNCRTRFLNTLSPGEVQAIHWNAKSTSETVRLRLATSSGQSDWIWSPPIPLDIGHSRELPAKMYRPKTHEQYIARVASKSVSGSSVALVIYGEDRQHPPYRVVNLCKERAVAFSQIETHERPWLVRAGKTSRYSWDNPLAPPKKRLLSLRILEMDELSLRTTEPHSGSASQSSALHRHAECVLNIDIVGDRVMVLSDSYEPTVVVNVSVDGATKIVTFCEEDENGKLLMATSPASISTNVEQKAPDQKAPDPVLVVGWDDMGHKPETPLEALSSRDVKGTVMDSSDYPVTEIEEEISDSPSNERVDTDAALFLESIGISVVTLTSAELLYICFKGVLVNYEAYSKLQCLAMHISECQVDNQLLQTPYPVAVWVHSAPTEISALAKVPGEAAKVERAVMFEIHREVTNDDIIMIKTFQGAIRPFSICFEDDLISNLLTFLSDTAIMGDTTTMEPLTGLDVEYREFEQHIFEKKRSMLDSEKGGTSSRQAGVPVSKRIYVHDFSMQSTSLRLTSSGSGMGVAKAAGVNASARALVALLLNVENCEFSFQPLHVQNVFDSVHHFAILVKDYYATQLSNQRINLLASNALVGNPAALFDAVGTGARELFHEPGKAKGSADFIAKVGRGSKSLLTHTVGGLVQSVSGIPRAVSSGLEKAVGDSDYLAERGRIRGSTLAGGRSSSARNPAQGFATGAVSFAHGISSGVTGFIKEPVQGAKQGGAGGLLKGIGKAFIGGVAKPVAGAIDLVAEPAAGLSHQIASADAPATRHDEVAMPERPPRAFRGQNERLYSFDQRYSVGVCLYRAVQLASGVSYSSELLDWIELSDRTERSAIGAEVWVWNVLRRYARGMPGTKKQLKFEEKNAESSGPRRPDTQSRPEKTRIALISRTDIVIATLDCKLVTRMPLWDDCRYRIGTQGKEVIVRITLRGGANKSAPSAGAAFSVGSLISAPWDAPSEGKRRRPAIGEELADRIHCGSPEASNDLYHTLERLTNEMEDARSHRLAGVDVRKTQNPSSSGVELASLSGSQDGNGQEMTQTGRSAGEKTGGLTTVNTLDAVTNDHGRNTQSESFGAGGLTTKAEARRELERKVRRLAVNRGGDRSRRTGRLRVAIVNELAGEQRLTLAQGSIEHGSWNIEPQLSINNFDVQVFSANCGPEAVGNVVYHIDRAQENERVRSDARAGSTPRVMLEFFCDNNSTPSFTTQASDGFRIDFERTNGGQETAVFTVRENSDRIQGSNSGGAGSRAGQASLAKSPGDGPKARATVTHGMSEDEISLKQLVDIGFKFEDAVVALSDAGGDLVKAVDILTRES